MARTKNAKSKATLRRKSVERSEETSPKLAPFAASSFTPGLMPESLTKALNPKSALIPAVAIILAALLWTHKSWIVVATVNNRPIFRWNFENRLVNKYGSQVLDDVVTEQIIKDQAAKEGIKVSSTDVDKKIADIEKSLDGKITLKELLSQQGMTETDLRNQLELQLFLEKMTASSVVVTDADIQKYIDTNKNNLPATDEASLREQVRQALTSQKRNQAFQDLFNSLKSKAKVVKFL